jgi:outer membrane protein OmpA-like peptidoglycan-associated protein
LIGWGVIVLFSVFTGDVRAYIGVFARAIAFVFVLMIVPKAANAAVVASELNQNQATRDALFKTLKAAAATQYKFDYMVIYLPPGSLPGVNVRVPVSHIRFSSTVFFAFDKAILEAKAESAVSEFANTVLQDKSFRSILVVGHTDSVGPDAYNATLSLNRAVAVASRLREAGVKEEFLGVVPMGEAQPTSTNGTPQGRALNRRVEFFISDVPGAPKKAIELIKFNPCYRNDHEQPIGQVNPECGLGDTRIPLYSGSTGQGRPQVMLELSRDSLNTPTLPTVRDRLPTETLQRPSLKELESD